MVLSRFENNPILAPSSNWWEMKAVFNPAATFFHDQILLLYRAVGGDGLSRFGLALSGDGKSFQRFPDPVFEADPEEPLERLGVEDPRITKIGDTYYITYTATSVYPAAAFKNKYFKHYPSLAPWRIRPSLLLTKDFRNFEKKGVLLEKDSKNAVLFPEKFSGRFVLLHRIQPNVQITFSFDLKTWTEEKTLLTPRNGFWDSQKVGVAGVPIKTDKGWLVFYNGVNQERRYSLGLLLLDLADPTKIVFRSEKPILEPEMDYEKVGLTPNVVFSCGAVEKGEQIYLYYGAADKVIGLAFLDQKALP